MKRQVILPADITRATRRQVLGCIVKDDRHWALIPTVPLQVWFLNPARLTLVAWNGPIYLQLPAKSRA
eukprot:12783797-Alexandrium_andersonii.AAC.1